MYSILITGFYLLIALITAGIAVLIHKRTQVPEVTDNENENTFQVSRMPVPQSYFVNLFVVFIFMMQIVMIFPFAVAFNKLRSFVFFEGAVFVIFLILALWYAIQKNMLRIKE